MTTNNNNHEEIIDDLDYSVVESSELLKITSQTTAKYLRSGELKGLKKGPKGKWFIKGSELKRIQKKWNML
jgi:hypothetical protein